MSRYTHIVALLLAVLAGFVFMGIHAKADKGEKSAPVSPKEIALSPEQLKTVKDSITRWIRENHDDPVSVEWVGHYQATPDDPKEWCIFKQKYRLTDSQGIKKLHVKTFKINMETGLIKE